MKPKFTCCFLIAICAIYLSSCQKDFVPENVPIAVDSTNVPGLPGDSIYLDKIYYLENANIPDTTSITSLAYDANKRVISLLDSGNMAVGQTYVESYKYFYIGNNARPYKYFHVSGYTNTSVSDTATTYIFYDSQGRKLKDSSVFFNLNGLSYEEYRYSYVPGFIYVQSFAGTSNGNFSPYYRDTAKTDTRGNVISNRRYSYFNGNYDLMFTSSYSYDNKREPFSVLSLHPAHFNIPWWETGYLDYSGYNNMLSQNEEYGNSNIDIVFTYTYNTLGLPIKRSGTYNGITEGLIFKYKSL